MQLKLVAYGIAKDILKAKEMPWPITDNYSIATLKQDLLKAYPALGSLTKLSFAVDEEYRDDLYSLKAGDEVVIIPPVSGG
jgi:molybdopterin converting factor small subunit